MGQQINPSVSSYNRVGGPLRVQQSLQQVLAAGITEAVPIGQAANGVFNQFVPDNGNGTTLRIGAYGAAAESYNWPSAPATGLVIYHNLGRQPIGFRVHDLEGNANIWRTVPPDATQITLATSDVSVACTVYIF